MTQNTYEINLNYTFDATRKQNKYLVEGHDKYMNHGEFAECLAKSVLGYEATKDANTRFDKGEDIAELNASVKSARAGLTDMKLGESREEFLANFWNMSNPKTNYIWVNDHDETVDLYYMDFNEFQLFVEAFGKWDAHDNKIRFTTCSREMVRWFNDHC